MPGTIGDEKMKQLLRLMVFGVVLVFMVSCATTATQSEKVPMYQETIKTAKEIGESLITQPGDVTAVTIAVMHDGEIVYSEGFGQRDIELNLPVDRHTRFNIGSVSKTFIAASILMLQEEGKLHLDDFVMDLLPDFGMVDERYRNITVRMLLNHVSGFPGTNWLDGFTAVKSSTYLEETLQELRVSTLKHDPGAFSPYCNDGFTVAQILLEHLTGMSYEQFLQERIFAPMQLHDTSVGFHPEEDNIAYAYGERTTRLPLEFVNIVASGGLTSTAEDLCRYAAITFSPTILNAGSLAEFLEEQKPEYSEGMDFDRLLAYGLGWDFTSWQSFQQQGLQVLGKTGGTLQYTTMLYVAPQSRSAVALICSGQIEPIFVTLRILDALLKETGLISADAKDGTRQSPDTKPLPTDYAAYQGYYGSESGVARVDFDPDSSSMHIYLHDGSSFNLYESARHIGDGLYETEAGKQSALRTLLGVPTIMTVVNPYARELIHMTKLPIPPAGLAHGFTESIWLPTNFRAADLCLKMFNTTILDELPSYLVVNSFESIPYAITSKNSTSMALPTLRDQTPPRLSEDGKLIFGPYRCIDIVEIASILPDEEIEVDAATSSVWRKIADHGFLTCEIPSGGRIIILDSDLNIANDTLYGDPTPDALELMAGSYVAFIANTQTIFHATFAPAR